MMSHPNVISKNETTPRGFAAGGVELVLNSTGVPQGRKVPLVIVAIPIGRVSIERQLLQELIEKEACIRGTFCTELDYSRIVRREGDVKSKAPHEHAKSRESE
jgi:hypothetical protein